MYERFYGLARTPFAVTPDPAMLFMSTVHREALATILYGVETRKGFIVCTGEVGTGKSTIIRAFFDQVRPDAVKLIYLFTSQVSPLEMAQYVCSELGLPQPASVFAAVGPLQLKLLDEFEHGRTVVLMIDEAQLLPPETLEFLRLLSNFETDTEKLIQIVLVGQPEVDAMLARRDMRQVNQRVALRARLAAFDLDESFSYIEHRLRVSGAVELPQVMTPTAAWLIAEAAAGIPRSINILADNALIAGFGAAQRPLGSQLAGRAVHEFLGKSSASAPARNVPAAAGWRAVRRLRGALARERAEPAEFVPAAPSPLTRLRPAASAARPPDNTLSETQDAGLTTARSAMPAPATVAKVASAIAPPNARLAKESPQSPEDLSPVPAPPAPSAILVEFTAIAEEPHRIALITETEDTAPGLPVFEQLPIIEPTEPSEPEIWGAPIDLADVVVIEPVAWHADHEPLAPGGQAEAPPAQRPDRMAGVDRLPAIDPLSIAPRRPQPIVAGGFPRRGDAGEWPALARVRSGLATSVARSDRVG